ncbi:MAG: hypothetical protein ACNS61_16215 [Candidatus Wenzhouxiangella sp. M2_3B_020]
MALKDKAVLIIVFLVFLQAVPSVLFASGVAADMGIDPQVSGSGNVDDARDAASNVEVSGGFAQTLFALYASVTGPVKTILGILFGAELMFISLGVPSWMVAFVFAPKFLVGFGAIVYTLAGRLL